MPQKTELLIHIGTHKTGSSSLQYYLRSNKDKLRSADKINILKFQIPHLADLQTFTHYNEEVVEEIKLFLSKNVVSGKKNLISHEAFSGNPLTFYSNFKTLARMLFDGTQDYNRKVIVFFRRQDQFIQSAFMQYKHQGEKFGIMDFYDREKIHYLNWHVFSEYYSNLFGQPNLRVCKYDPSVFKKMSLINSFGNAIDSKIMAEDGMNVADNVGFSMKALEIFELLSNELEKEEIQLLRKKMQSKFKKEIGAYYNILGIDEMTYIHDYFLESNTKLADLNWGGNSFSIPEISKEKKFGKNQMYQQLIIDLIKNEHKLKSEIKTYKSSITNRLINKIRRLSIS